LGYKPGTKGVVLVDINNREISVSRNVTHHEHIFPYQSHNNSAPWLYYPSTQSPPNTTIESSQISPPPSPDKDSIPLVSFPTEVITSSNTPNHFTSVPSTDTPTIPHSDTDTASHASHYIPPSPS
ncbi:retrovirus-related pol polyprotein from transposon TNT 1-94, partial [Trifolium medium]|nr:retrovirus-related pol polyprotein from transposon TNT 1-94 [Trifolium medium]